MFAEYVIDNVFGRKVGILSPYQYNVWITISLPTEFYLNLGIVGVIVLMFFLGIVYRVAYEIIEKDITSPGHILLYFTFWYFWIYLGFYLSISKIIIFTITKMLMILIALEVITDKSNKKNSMSEGFHERTKAL